jgi:hypothetical protein
MAEFGPLVGAMTWHAMALFGIGGAVGGGAMTWWQQRAAEARASVD